MGYSGHWRNEKNEAVGWFARSPVCLPFANPIGIVAGYVV